MSSKPDFLRSMENTQNNIPTEKHIPHVKLAIHISNYVKFRKIQTRINIGQL